MGGHHLVYGKLRDIVTGAMIEDTDDERLRQGIGRLLIDQKGYDRSAIQPRVALTVTAGPNRAVVPVDFLVHAAGRCCLLIKYGPGSLVTRHTPALAATRLVAPYQVPLAVVTNGRDADVLDTLTGNCIGSGFAAIPAARDMADLVPGFAFSPITPRQVEMASRVIYAYEVDGACPCDDTVCRLPDNP